MHVLQRLRAGEAAPATRPGTHTSLSDSLSPSLSGSLLASHSPRPLPGRHCGPRLSRPRSTRPGTHPPGSPVGPAQRARAWLAQLAPPSPAACALPSVRARSVRVARCRLIGPRPSVRPGRRAWLGLRPRSTPSVYGVGLRPRSTVFGPGRFACAMWWLMRGERRQAIRVEPGRGVHGPRQPLKKLSCPMQAPA